MGEWKKVRIGKIFHLEKGCLQSSKCIQGKYDFITAAKDWKTHNILIHMTVRPSFMRLRLQDHWDKLII